MTSEELVHALAADLTPVRRLRSVAARTTTWTALALLGVGLGSSVLGVRADLSDKLADAAYLAESAALLAIFAFSARSAFQLSVPGAERGVLTRILPVVALLAWLLLIVSRSVRGIDVDLGGTPWPHGLHCASRMTELALAPAAAAFFMLRKAAPQQRGWTGFLALLSAGSLAMLGTQVLCSEDDPGHVLIWHVAPVVLVALLGIAAGRTFLRRRSWRYRGMPRHC